ncbi:MAG: tetratricopeptide repeat protein [Verrucomicrobiota bacterium]
MDTLSFLLPRIMAALFAALFIAGCSVEAKKETLRGQAERDFKSGEYDKAKIEYMNLLRLDPQDATIYQQLGLIWFEEGAPLRAAPFLFKARELAPNNLNNRAKLASTFLSIGDLKEARKEALAILQQSPGNDEAIKILAETARTPQEIDESREQLQKFSQQDSVAFHLASASLSQRKGDLPSAEKALQRALALEPKSPSAHLAMGSLQLLQKNSVQAGQELRSAADLASVRSIERLKYAEYKARTGASGEATEFLKTMTKQAPDYLPAWRLLAQIAVTNKKYDEALAFLENVFSRDADDPDARILEAQTHLAKGEPQKALEGLDRLDKKYPNFPPIKYQLASAYVQNNNPSQAISILTQTVSTSPNYLEALLLLGELNLRAGNAQAVVTSMMDLLKKQPDLFPAEVLLADGYRFLGRPDEAAEIFRKRIKDSPQNSQAHFLLGVTLRQQKKTDEARRAFEKALELVPENLAIIDQIVDLDILAKDFPSATRRVEQQLSKNAQSPDAHFMQAKIHVAEGKVELAEAALLKTVELDPNFAKAYDLLINTYLANNKLPQALTQLQALLAKKPDNVSALMLSALIYDKLADFPKARDAYEKLLSTRPDFTPALNNLAYLYAERFNQLDKASDLARKARAAQPSDASIADTLGWILYRQGDYQQALTLLQESAGKVSDDPEIQFHLGMAGYMMGQTELALTALQKAAAAPADFPGKEQIQGRLALLGSAPGHELSVGELETLLKQQPGDLIARVRLGEVYEKQGMFAKSASAYEDALKANPKLGSVVTKLAQLNAGPLQNKEKALEFAKRARELAPSDPKIAGALGSIAYQAGNFTWAYSLLQESSRQLADDPAILHDFAWAAYSLGKVSEAEQAMQRVLQVAAGSPQSEDAKSFLAMTALSRTSKDLAAAESEAQKLLKADSGYVPALMVQAAVDVQQNKIKPAADVYSEVLRRFPDFAPAQKYLAALYSEDPDNITKAYDLATKARKTLTDDTELAQILATISYQKKDYRRAIQLFQESTRNKPLDAKSLFYLGMSYAHANQKSQAGETLNRALSAGLQEPLAAEAKKAVAELQQK